MEPKTLEALRASIAKWERNAEMTDSREMRTGISDCALCTLFLYEGEACKGCPVYQRTGRIRCVGTPYCEVVDYLRSNSERIAAAHAEVAFLRSLLPEGEA